MAHFAFAKGAISDLDNIYDYIASERSLSIAEGVVRRIEETCRLIASQPEMGREHSGLLSLRAFPVKNHIIFYRPVEDGIEVARVLHGRMDIQDALSLSPFPADPEGDL